MKKPSFRKQINKFCRECIVDPTAKGEGTWKAQVGNCTSPKCPLFNLRPLPEGMIHPWQEGAK